MTEAFDINVGAARDPDGKARVLLQLPDGYVLLGAADAREVARLLEEAAVVVEDVVRVDALVAQLGQET